MTIGYPDDQAFPNATGSPIADQQAFSLSAATPFDAQGFITNFASARVRVNPSGGGNGCVCTVAYYADATLADQLGLYSWTISATSQLSAIVPNLGPYLKIDVTTSIGPAFTCQIQLTPVTTPVDKIEYPATGNEASMNAHSIGAGNTFTVILPFVVEGAGHVFVYPHDATGTINAEVDELTQMGTIAHKITGKDGLKSTAEWNGDFQAPAATIQLAVTNTDTVGHTVDAAIVVTGR